MYDTQNIRKYRRVGGFIDGEHTHLEISGCGRAYRAAHVDGTHTEWGETKDTPFEQVHIDARIARGEWEEVTDDAG